jgi:hypothetical protein
VTRRPGRSAGVAAGRPAPAGSDVDQTGAAGSPADTEFAEWVYRLQCTYRAVAFTCRHRLSNPAHAESLAVWVVAGLLERPTVFRYFGLPFSGRIAALAENMLAEAEAGNPPAPADWSELENRVLSIPDHHRKVLISVCLNGDDIDTLAAKLGCDTEEAIRRRTALIGYMRDVVAGDLTAISDDEV